MKKVLIVSMLLLFNGKASFISNISNWFNWNRWTQTSEQKQIQEIRSDSEYSTMQVTLDINKKYFTSLLNSTILNKNTALEKMNTKLKLDIQDLEKGMRKLDEDLKKQKKLTLKYKLISAGISIFSINQLTNGWIADTSLEIIKHIWNLIYNR